ncbi:unnamed protein product [Adineta steineri]|uniref:DnaJ-like protein n=1 Tax=Adineta steineri TaxID=433720 RepID=A0A815HKT5_9BILA|nr:unnamed protein product [Adineta steineri]CAF3865615.1 unnamed protein product [Adineta steineri]
MVVDKTLYDVLNVEPNASQETISKAVKRKSLEHHPDRGGSHEMMQQVNAAKEILTDPEKREIYDRYGLKGMQSRMEREDFQFPGFHNDIFDIFNLFNRGSNHQNTAQTNEGDDIKHVLQVSLEELYSGSTRVAVIERNIVCNNCTGSGSRNGISRECTNCHGTGVETSMQRIGPFVQQIRRECLMCDGTGNIVDSKNQCRACFGKKIVREEKIIEVNIVPGSRNSEIIRYPGEAHQIPNGIPGTLYIILKQAPHEIFTRKDNDLLMNMDINLTECLCGFQRLIELLDGHQILIDHPPGKPILPDSYRCLKGHGMPNRHTHSHGDLIIQFDVKFPDENHFHLTDNQRQQLESILPPKKRVQLNSTDRYERPEMVKCDMTRENFQNDHQEEDEDHDFDQQPESVRCQQQ